MNLSTHFTVKELVDPETVTAMGEARAANTADQRLIYTLEVLKAAPDYAAITVNA